MEQPYFVLTDPHGNECVKRGAAAAFDYASQHRGTTDELTRRRGLVEDVAGWPVDPMKLWNWKPSE